MVVRVKERAVDGQATRAVLAAVAGAFGLRGGDVELLSGARSRTKIIRLTGEESALRERLTALLDGR